MSSAKIWVVGLIGTVSGGYFLYNRFKKNCEFSKIETPIQKIDYSPHYVSYYCRNKKIPIAVEEIIKSTKLTGQASRKFSNFYEDKKIPEIFQSKLKDYKGTYFVLNLNRGHMRGSQDGMNSSFSLGNILPQNADNNCDLWNTFEMFSRHLANDYDKVRVISGGLFIPRSVNEEDSKLINKKQENWKNKLDIDEMNFKTIGSNQVHVPTHLFKILSCENGGKKNQVSAFIMPNKENSDLSCKMIDFEVPLEEVEKRSGLIFSGLREKGFESFCKNNHYCSELTKKEYDMVHIKENFLKTNDLNVMVGYEMHLQRKKIQLNEVPEMDKRIKDEFEKEFSESKSKHDHCGRVQSLLELNKILSNSSMKNNREYKEKFLKSFRASLSYCYDDKVLFEVKRYVKKKNYWIHDDVIKTDKSVKKILDI